MHETDQPNPDRKREPRQIDEAKQNHKGVLGKILAILGIIALSFVLILCTVVFVIILKAPEFDTAKLVLAQNPQIFDKDNVLMTTLISAENRQSAKIGDMPQVLKDAVVCLEDVRFYEHSGIDFKRIAKAIISNLTKGFGSEGASTITQQVVKNLFLNGDKTWTRKIQEQYLAIRLEKEYSKDKILELYMNAIYFSDSRYGVLAAADYYFSKKLSDLTLADAALLAAIPQRPNYFNPFKNPEAAEVRRNLVIDLMDKNNKITSGEAAAARNIPIAGQLQKRQRMVYPYQSFVDQVLNELEASESLDPSDIYTKGLKIYTTLDPKLQQHVDQVMQSGDSVQFPDDKIQAGITVMDTKTGKVLAIGGTRKPTEGVRNWNWATNPRRSPGSSIKPVLDYGPAVNEFQWSTFHQIVDEPHTFSNGVPVYNYDLKYRGAISMRKALETSRNIPAVKTFQEVGIEKAKAFGERLGIELDSIEEAYSIGGFQTGVSSYQMAGAFGAFGNNGIYNGPHTVIKVVFPEGKVLDMAPKAIAAMNDYTAFIITDMLRTVVEGSEGTGRFVAMPGIQIAGKTGSSNFSAEEKKKYDIVEGIKDSWFVGYTTELTTSVWTGYGDNADGYIDTSPDSVAGQLAKRLFRNIMTFAQGGRKVADFVQPDSVVQLAIDRSTGLLPSNSTSGSEIIKEYFVVGTEPTANLSNGVTGNGNTQKSTGKGKGGGKKKK